MVNIITCICHFNIVCTCTRAHIRVESESIDYSTQYPWSFGILSVIMATGLHPLKDYPENFEGGSKVKYRSHDYQALPDSEQVCPAGMWCIIFLCGERGREMDG